jgi:hypothetical protein
MERRLKLGSHTRSELRASAFPTAQCLKIREYHRNKAVWITENSYRNPKQRKVSSMLASPACYDKSAGSGGSVFSAFLKHLNAPNLALMLFVALALFTPTRAREPEATGPLPKNTAKTELTIHGSGFLPETVMLTAMQDVTCFRRGLEFLRFPQNSRKLFFVNSPSNDRKTRR